MVIERKQPTYAELSNKVWKLEREKKALLVKQARLERWLGEISKGLYILGHHHRCKHEKAGSRLERCFKSRCMKERMAFIGPCASMPRYVRDHVVELMQDNVALESAYYDTARFVALLIEKPEFAKNEKVKELFARYCRPQLRDRVSREPGDEEPTYCFP